MVMKHEIELSFNIEEYVNQEIDKQGVTLQNTITQYGDGELLLELEVAADHNMAVQQTVDLQVCFTIDESSLPIKPLHYCYPAREFVLSAEDCDYHCNYGYRFPLSFVSALYKNKGLTLIFADQEQTGVGVKKGDGQFQFIVEYKQVPVQGGRRSIILHFHDGDWHEGFERYKSWYKNKYLQSDAIEKRLKDCYHIRRYFFHEELCKTAIYNGEGFLFSDQYRNDGVEVGGIDVALLFDYAYTPENKIRCGNRHPFTNLKNLEELNAQLQDCKRENKLTVYAYFDPYLIQNGSDFDKTYRATLPVLNEEGDRHHVWGEAQWHPCLSREEWQDESVRYLTEVSEKLAVDGLYLDEIGNGELFVCHDKAHGHEVPLNQNKAEQNYVHLLQKEFPDKLLMCEFFPADSNISLFPAVLSDSRTIVDICRFAFPYKKIFKIINCDRPIGNNTWDISKIFFNGMGLWLDNDLHNTEWYAPEVKALIKKHYQILKAYSYIFESGDVEPLVPINSDAILANRFTWESETVFTFLNVTKNDAQCYFDLGEKYNVAYDAYNNKSCPIITHNGRHSVKIELTAQSAGCIYVVKESR